jgi:hypothetical protein
MGRKNLISTSSLNKLASKLPGKSNYSIRSYLHCFCRVNYTSGTEPRSAIKPDRNASCESSLPKGSSICRRSAIGQRLAFELL